jgi:hypothetical protein
MIDGPRGGLTSGIRRQENMSNRLRFKYSPVLTAIASLLVALSLGSAQEESKPEEYQTQAMGQGTQLGQTFGITIHIQEYSTPEERQVLVDAFKKRGSQGLYNALGKMKSKGQIAVTGTLGYEISFARKIETPDGYEIRVLTNRPITFGEAWADSRSMDYDLSAFKLTISKEKGKSTGELLLACEFKINSKTNEIDIDALQNPWNLTDVIDWSDKDKK